MRIAICDDLTQEVEIIKKATIEYFQSKNLTVVIETFHHAFDFLDAYDKKKYDMVLLDIVMPGVLGTDIAREIRMKQDKTEIIFLTTSNEFAVDAFEVKATHYLLKPFKQDVFIEAMNRALSNMDRSQKKVIQFKGTKGVVQTIDLDSISHIESNAHHQFVFRFDGAPIETVQTLTELFNRLNQVSPEQFIRPYKGFIVNQHAIASIQNDCIVLKRGIHIPIPRRTFNSIKQTYFDYMFKGRQ